MVKLLIVFVFLYCSLSQASTDLLSQQPIIIEDSLSVLSREANARRILPQPTQTQASNASINLLLSNELLSLSFYQAFFKPAAFPGKPRLRLYKEVPGAPLNGCKPEQDPFQCAEPIIYDLSADYRWVKPGKKISFQVHIANYTEATLAAYDYATQKLITIQQWKSGISQRTRELHTNFYTQNNDTIYHLEVKNPHGQLTKSFTIYNFRHSQTTAVATNAAKNSPQLIDFTVKPNPTSLNSPARVNFSFIGADEYFLLRNNRVIAQKKNLNPDVLQEHIYRELVTDKGPHLFKVILMRNLSSNPEKNKRLTKTLQLSTSPAAEIIEFSSNKTQVLAGEKVSFSMKITGAEYVFLDMLEEGGILQNFPITPLPSMPLQRSKTYQFSTFMNIFDNTDFRLRISNPDSGAPITKTIRILAKENRVTNQLEIRSLTVKPKFAAGEEVMVRFVATNADSYTLYSNEGLTGSGVGAIIDIGQVTPDNLGFVTKSIPIKLSRPATELTLKIRHSSGGSIIKTIPIQMYWKVKYKIPIKTIRTSPRPHTFINKLAVSCRMGDRYLQTNFVRPVSPQDNFIHSLKGIETQEFKLGIARYHVGFGSHTETFTDTLTFEQELQFKPTFQPSLVPFSCHFSYAKVCKKENGKWSCDVKDNHKKYAKSFIEAFDKSNKYEHHVNFNQHSDFSKPFEINLRKTMEWEEKP